LSSESEFDAFLRRLRDPRVAARWQAELEALWRAMQASQVQRALDSTEESRLGEERPMSPFDDDELLSLYLEAELAGKDAAALYPAFAALLARDPALAADYAALRRALLEAAATGSAETDAEPRAGPLTELREERAPYRAPSAPGAALWTARVFSSLAGGPLRVLFTLQPAFWSWLRGPAWGEMAVRGEPGEAGQEPFLLLAQSVALGEDEGLAELRALRVAEAAGEGERLHLFAALAASRPLPVGTRVLLTWGGAVHAAILDAEGSADLGEVAWPGPGQGDDAPRAELAFEIPAQGRMTR
jgi:hypothetical protein